MSIKGFIVFDKFVSAQLMLKGENLIGVRQDLKDDNKMVYVFKDSSHIEKNLKKINDEFKNQLETNKNK